MKPAKALLAIVLSVFLSSCATNYYKPVNSTQEYQTKQVKNYALNETKTAYVGEPLIELGTLYVINSSEVSFRALRNVTPGGMWFACKVQIEKDKIYPVQSVDEVNKKYAVFVGTCVNMGFASRVHVEVNDQGQIASRHAFINGKKNLFPFFAEEKEGAKVFEKIEIVQARGTGGTFKHELIYNGKDGDNIKVMYREFKNDLARPAFYQDLIYNLSESPIIRYRNFKIRVLNANNEEIVYQVLED